MLYKKDMGDQNSFQSAVIDTMVAEIQSVPGEDRCVLLLGYKDQMVEMFQVIQLVANLDAVSLLLVC
jgi:hypothetical protein